MLPKYLGKLKVQIFCRCGRKRKQIVFLVASNFVIHPQILIFSVFTNSESFAILIAKKIFHVTVLLKPNSITLASSEMAQNMFEAGSCQIPLH